MTRLTALHQWVPTLAGRDAIGNHARALRDAIREDVGLESELFYVNANGPVPDGSAHHRRMRPDPSGRTGILYHLSIGSEMADVLRDRPEPLAVDHHNVTPVRFFDAWEPGAAYDVALGRNQVGELAERTTLGLADSAYNAADLDAHGYRRTAVVPILLDIDGLRRAADPTAIDRASGGGTRWLFVGRLAPNKCQHDVVTAFAAYRRVYDPDARLDLVGAPASQAYATALRKQIAGLGIADAVTLTGSVDDGELGARYALADVLVCLSEHEGFCVPLLEAMANDVPVVAFGTTAVPETVGGGGLVLPDKSPARVAAAVHRIATDRTVGGALVAAGRRRLDDFAPERTRARFVEAVRGFVEGDLR